MTGGAAGAGDTGGIMERLRNVLGDNAPAVMLNLVVMLVTNNLLLLLVSAFMPVDASSAWFLCLALSGFLLIADRGISYPLSRRLSLHRPAGQAARFGRHAAAALALFARTVWPSYLLVVGVLTAYVLFVARADPVLGARLPLLWATVCLFMAFSMTAKFFQMANEGLGRLRQERYVSSACQIGLCVLGAVLVIATGRIELVPIAYIAAYGLQALFLYRGAEQPHGDAPEIEFDAADLEAIRSESWLYWRLAIVNQVAVSVQVMSLAFFADPAMIAAFFFLQRLDSGIGNVLGFVVVVHRAQIANMLGNKNYRQVIRLIKHNYLIIGATTLAGCCGMVAIVVACNALDLLSFTIPLPLLGLFILSVLFTGFVTILAQYLLALGRNQLFFWFLACAVATVALQAVLVPPFGSYGAIGAFLIAQLCTTGLANIWYFTRALRDLRAQATAAEAKGAQDA